MGPNDKMIDGILHCNIDNDIYEPYDIKTLSSWVNNNDIIVKELKKQLRNSYSNAEVGRLAKDLFKRLKEE